MKKKWYQKKHYWIITGIIGVLFFIGRLEFLQLRYQPDQLANSLVADGQSYLMFKRKSLDGINMQYCQLGNNPSLPIIVFVHGSPGSLSAFEAYFKDKVLSQRANLIAVDRLGFGYSDFGKAIPSLSLQAKLIATVLADYPHQPKILVGHSMGGSVISRLAMDFPHLVDGLVLIAAAISPALEPPNWWRKILDLQIIRWLIPSAFRVCNQEIISLKEELLLMEPLWGNIQCPVTIIHGTKDGLVPVGNAYYAQEKLINSASVYLEILSDKNHFIVWSEIPFIIKGLLRMVADARKN